MTSPTQLCRRCAQRRPWSDYYQNHDGVHTGRVCRPCIRVERDHTRRYCLHERRWSLEHGDEWSAMHVATLHYKGWRLHQPRRYRAPLGWTRQLDAVTSLHVHPATRPCPIEWLPPFHPEDVEQVRTLHKLGLATVRQIAQLLVTTDVVVRRLVA